jgi:hypothetical protein
MNEVHPRASEWVQSGSLSLLRVISEPGHPTGDLRDPLEEETTMLRTISAALLAVSVIAAPALAETAAKTTPAPVSKTSQAPLNKTTQAPVIKPDQSKSKVMNANARMAHHKHMGTYKTHATGKVVVKPAHPAAKRG